VRPVSQTPTEPADYAALSTVYGVLLGATALSARGSEPVPGGEVPVLAAATFALSKLIVKEKAESWLRQPFVDEAGASPRPKGRRLRYAVGELLTCTRCTGAWSAPSLVALRLHAPSTGRAVAAVLAASAGNDMLQAGFSWLCAGATTSERAAGPPVRRSAA
jgi:Protein of unknown function (DUF1360)